MPFETQGPEPLDAVINVRLTAAEKARLKEDADLAGSGGIYNKDTAGALVALKAYIGKLSRDRQEG